MTSPNLYDIERTFQAFANSCGIAIPEPLKMDGAIHTFYIDGDTRGTKNGRYQLWPDGKSGDGRPHGWCMNHKCGGEKAFWQFYNKDNPPPRGRPSAVEQEAVRARREAEAREEATRKREASEEAARLWEGCRGVSAGDHLYLNQKGLSIFGEARITPDGERLVIPWRDIQSGAIFTIQTIDTEGKKLWYKGAPKRGGFILAGDVSDGPCIIAEGYATACSIFEALSAATPASVLAAGDAGLLKQAAEAARARWPGRPVYVAADEDWATEQRGRGNAGIKAARAVLDAGLADGLLVPPFPRKVGDTKDGRSDWNDFAVEFGVEATTRELLKQLRAAAERTSAPQNELSQAKADYLQSVDGTDFWTVAIPETKWIVPDVLRTGLGVLIGAQKMGKSTLVTDLALAVATGGVFLNHFKVEQGDVLYLNYEDDMNDLRDRAQALGYQHAKEGFSRLQIEFNAPRQDSGGMELIHTWAESHPNRRLLIIDPLVKFRRYRRQEERGLDAYQLDYAVIGEIHSEAIKYGFSVLTLQHENKIPGNDWVLRANGSVALTAAASSIIRLDRKRGQLDAKLSITGRGVKDKEYAIKGTGLRWEYCGDAQEYAVSQLITSITSLLRQGEKSVKDIADTLEIAQDTVRRTLNRRSVGSPQIPALFYKSLDGKRWGVRAL